MHHMLVWLLAYTAEWGTIVVTLDNDTGKGGIHHAPDRP
jgi:hypothetical protein